MERLSPTAFETAALELSPAQPDQLVRAALLTAHLLSITAFQRGLRPHVYLQAAAVANVPEHQPGSDALALLTSALAPDPALLPFMADGMERGTLETPGGALHTLLVLAAAALANHSDVELVGAENLLGLLVAA